VRVVAGTDNLPPVAGIRTRAVPGGALPLRMDATASYDVDGDRLSYLWTVESVPAGGSASFSDASAPMPDLSLTGSGQFTIGLRVQDAEGLSSETALYQVLMTPAREVAPVASFRFDQLSGAVGETLAFEPFGSTDQDGSALTAEAGIVFAPAGQPLGLQQGEAGSYRFTPGAAGDYLASVAVGDGSFVAYDQLLLAADGNVRPTARILAAPVAAGQTVALDGTQSFDLNGDMLSYSWSLLSSPAGSAAALDDPQSPKAALRTDVAGLYVVQLKVHDGGLSSQPVTFAVRAGGALPVADAGLDQLAGTGTFSLDGSQSQTTGAASFAWSTLGLTGNMESSSGLTGSVQTGASLSATVGRFDEVIRTSPVYHFKRAMIDDGYCAFDTRRPSDIPGAPVEPVSMTIHSRGQQALATGTILIWEIENKTQTTRNFTLRDSTGTAHGTWVLPGRTSLHVKTGPIGSARMDVIVNGLAAANDRAKTNPFNRNNPVCKGVGAAVFQLIVADQNGISLPDTVLVANANLRPTLMRPVAVEGAADVAITLSATGLGADANGDALTYSWSLIRRPETSASTLNAPTTDSVGFTPDVAGIYLVQMKASDGVWSAIPVVFVIEVPNAAPIAVATGSDQVFVGETATFHGTASSDPDGNALQFLWQIQSAPVGSTAALTNATAPVATLVPDRPGTYVVTLTVSDYELSAPPVSLTLTVPNRAPVASLTAPSEITVGDPALISAASSADADGDPLSYSFALVSAPATSVATLDQVQNGQVELIADLPGEYRVSVAVSDGVVQDTAEIVLTARSRNAPPVLQELQAVYTVELGLKLHLALSGNDPDGRPVSYYISPLPLPTGMTLNASTGLISFRPEAGQEGSYTLTIGVSDGTLTDTQTITVNVVPADAGDTAITGRVLDAVDFANGVETPLAGIPVRLRDSSLATVTDADGGFSFGSLSRVTDVVLVEPSAAGGPGGYLGTSRSIRITANQIRDIDPDFLLAPLTDGCASVVAGSPTVLVGAQSGVTVTVPADSVTTIAGAAYTGQICLGSLPQLFADPGLPQDTAACHIYALAAPGAVFTQPLAISAPNADLLPEQTRLDLWRAGGSKSLFRRTASAGVDAGGATVSGLLTPSGDGALFTFLPQAPLTAAAADMPTGNTSLTPFSGDLSETYVLPGYRAFGSDQRVGISYHSKAADPSLIAAGEVTIASDASLPVGLTSVLRIGGLSINDTAEWTPRLRSDGYAPALVGEEVSLRQALPLDGTGLASGRYKYDFVARAKYGCSTVSSNHRSELHVQNESGSPYGNGWSIDGLQKLVVGADGSVAIIDDDGVATFDPATSLTEFDGEPLVFPTVGTQSVAAIDYDGDGVLDVSYAAAGTGAAGLIRNNGGRDLVFDREFAFATTTVIPPTASYIPNLLKLAPGDLSGDGFPDLAYGLQGQRAVGYLANDGFGNFTNVVVPRADGRTNNPRDVAVTDLDGDGYNDFISLHTSASFISSTRDFAVAYGSPSGIGPMARFASASLSSGPVQVEIGDVDGNGRNDAVIRRAGGNGLTFVFQTGFRVFAGPTTPAAVGTSGIDALGDYFKLADFNGDGKLDIVWSGTDNLTVFLNANTTGRTFLPGVALARPPFAVGAMYTHVEDVNGDGLSDVIVSAAENVAVYLGNGDGTFQPFETTFVDYPMIDLAFADVDGDGSLDMISAQRFSVTVHFSKRTTSGKFIAGNGEFSTLVLLPDGTYERRYKDGTKVLFDASGRQIAEVDPQGNSRIFAYDAGGRLTTITDQVGGITEFFYETVGARLALIRYPDGRETTFTYDPPGNLNQIVEPEGGKVVFSYDENNRLISTTNQNGNRTSYGFDATGQMSGATLPDGSSIRNRVATSLGLVDGLGDLLPSPLAFIPEDQRVTTVTDRKGQTTEIVVNQFGATVRVTDPLGRVTKIDRDENNLATRVERPAADGGIRVDEMEYDAVANIKRMVEASGTPFERETLYDYDPVYNKVTRMEDPGGFVTLYEYDATGLVTKIIDAETGERTFSYLPDGQLSSRTDENGNLTGFTYDAKKNVDTITYADGSVTDLTYDLRGNTTVMTEALGLPEERRMVRTYDLLNRVRSVETTGPDGQQIDGITTYLYDTAGNLKTVTDETGLVTTMGYDGLERLVAIDDPAEGLITRTYNAAGEVTEHVNGDGEVHEYAYDAVSRLTGTTDPEGYTKTFAYDLRDNVTSVTDGRGGITTFTYDVLNRMTTRTNPLGLTMGRTYDSRDNLVELIREDGVAETAIYDSLGRRIFLVVPDHRPIDPEAPWPDNFYTYAYDPVGNLTLAEDNDSSVSFTWDERNRLRSATTDGTVGPQPEVSLTYYYDALDRRTTMIDNFGATTTYAWDVEGRLATLTAPWGTEWTFGYDGEGRRTSLASSTGRATSYGYANGLLTALSHAQSGVVLTDLAYTYGADGQLTATIDNLDPTKSQVFAYDALNRLLQVAEGLPLSQGGVPVPVEDYAYDGEGNRTASHLSLAYAANEHNQLLEDDNYQYAYDERGNRTTRVSKASGDAETYTYDRQNRLIGYISPTTEATYAYDALDRRIAKTVDGVTEAYIYDSADLGDSTASNPALTFRAGALVKRWLFGPQVDEPLAYEAYTGTTTPGSGSVIELLANRLGSIITAVSVSTGAIAAEYDYQAYGARVETAALEQPYGFTGREHDAESGLIYFRARVYDPVAGLFLQVDPIEMTSGTAHLYSYAAQNPVFYTDPTGLLAPSDPPGRVGGQVGETLNIWAQQTAMRSSSVGHVSAGTIGAASFIVASLELFKEMLDLDEGLPDDETPTPEPEPAGAGKGPPRGHHCWPTSYGFPVNQELVYMSQRMHDRLHALMRKHFKAMTDQYIDKLAAMGITSMDYGKGRPNSLITDAVGGLDVIKGILDDFYQRFPEFGC
jgi:RHS repeat-associated protein